MKIPTYLFLALFLISDLSGNEEIGNLVGEIVQREIKAGRVIGATIAVAKGDEVLHLKGYGTADLENNVNATEHGVYRIGSITKLFTAAGILLLVEDGKLDLDDPLAKFIPDYPKAVADKVTVRHLLQHTSGIFSYTDLPNRRLKMRLDLTSDQILNEVKNKPVHFQPGENFKYCNTGYFLLGLIIEKVSEKKFSEFLEDRILKPLKLDSTRVDRNSTIIPNRVRGYARWGGKTVNANYTSMTQPFSAGAMVSTAGDLIKWQRALVNGNLLSPESYQLMTEPGTLKNEKKIPYGLGCFVSEKTAQKPEQNWHGGGIPGFISELVYFPGHDLTIVVLSNSMQAKAHQMSREIAREITKRQ